MRKFVVEWVDARTGSLGSSQPLDLDVAEGHAKILRTLGHTASVVPVEDKKGGRR